MDIFAIHNARIDKAGTAETANLRRIGLTKIPCSLFRGGRCPGFWRSPGSGCHSACVRCSYLAILI